MKILTLAGHIELLSGLHIGGGDDTMKIGGIDNQVIKDINTNKPYIPGSSLKGKMRSLLEWNFGLVGISNGDPFSPKFLNDPVFNDEKKKENAINVIKIFGASGEDASNFGITRISVGDGSLVEEGLKTSEAKYENVIDRKSGTAQHPRQTERVPAGVKFNYNIKLKVLDGDDELQRSYKLKNNCKIIWIGIQNKDVDVFASNIKSSNEGTTFKVTFKGDKKAYEFKTKLLGYANIYNILASLALAKEFGLTVNQMQKVVLGVKSVEHRLELRNTGLITYIDDAYNSNPVGSKMALEVLKEMSGKRIVMTPGMVELGSKDYELNKAFGTYMKGCCDEVILVGKNKTKPIMDGLLETKFPKDKVYVVASTNEGFNLIKKLSDGKKSSVLIENDLPDSYNE